ncbi:MAG: hypothetical protein IPJ74_08895 [Saprospiraceae bacterium]|nr:hypothetical protein [Saprospiraceae bacterium]
MLQFFRNIRRRLLDSGSLRKYLVYAIGEILLVVIGILIALQINTLNNDRIDRKKEKETIKAIYNELEANRQYLETLKKLK